MKIGTELLKFLPSFAEISDFVQNGFTVYYGCSLLKLILNSERFLFYKKETGERGIVLLTRVKRHPGKSVVSPWDAFARSRSNLTRLRLVVLIPCLIIFKLLPLADFKNGGERGIRTPGGIAPTQSFQDCTIGHSDTSPS